MYSQKLPYFFPALLVSLIKDFVSPYEMAHSLKTEVWFMAALYNFLQ